MKAGKETEMYNQGYMDGYNDGENAHIDSDYWDRLTHQAAITAMQGIMSNPVGFESIRCTSKDHDKKVAEIAICFARELIEGLKLIRSN